MTGETRIGTPAAEDVLGASDFPDRLLIGGEWVEGAGRKQLAVIDPATGREVARVACAEAEDVDRAVAAAEAAFDDGAWSRMPHSERARTLHRFADAIEARIEDLYRVETVNNGRPITETRAPASGANRVRPITLPKAPLRSARIGTVSRRDRRSI